MPDVNLLFDDHIETLRKIYRSHFAFNKSYMSLHDALNMMTKDAVFLLAKEATECYGLAKMTVINEMQFKGDTNPYLKLAFVEFLEYIGRIAEFKYRNEEISLKDKIDKVLKEVLPLALKIKHHSKISPSKTSKLVTPRQNPKG